ncbi:unnamed protein product [Cylindrotheca closterium]|uniref:Fe2OG dioxygenase domain-containing protein n=1 Tax=Cylindrotheca closterium TaxID=2856 RepID=A0AAD2FUA3_9STRA|nr:unnamed protein product [Cylindrotheca closterium]
MQIRHYLLLVLSVFALLFVSVQGDEADSSEQTCTWSDRHNCGGVYRDANLKEMQVNLVGREPESFFAYVHPDISTFYNKTEGSMAITETKFNGMMGKFVNMAATPITIYWKSHDPRQEPVYISQIEAYGAAGTATYPGHVFLVTPLGDSSIVLHEFQVVKGNSLYIYDPIGSLKEAQKTLPSPELERYKLQYDNLAFNNLYEQFTGRQWLALYGRKEAPRYYMWPAESFGQVHTVVTKETHLLELPSDDRFEKMIPLNCHDPELREALQQYKGSEETLILNMTVVSVAPRVFEIKNFLSPAEVQHVLEVALGMKLSQSTTKAGSVGQERTDDATRTSKNSWLSRHRSPIIDSIIRRSADLLQMDEALFRRRNKDEEYLVPETKIPISERLQLVHYDVGQQYTPHHDFSIPSTKHGQPSRFATILFYLNDVQSGGETSFPRWMNGEKKDILRVAPEVGKAVLFYNQLPDGNYDERSQHAALPVGKGEKWLTNLWVWDPHM